MNNLSLEETSLSGVFVLDHIVRGDSRGHLERLYCEQELTPALGARRVVQINRTMTRTVGTVRGVHYQLPPAAETKIVSCLRGRVLDVAVDLRASSPTFLKWHAEILTADKPRALVIPEGCGHAFQTLAPDCELLYFHTAHYSPALEGGVHAEDPMIGIDWPLSIADMSPRDKTHPMLDSNFEGIVL